MYRQTIYAALWLLVFWAGSCSALSRNGFELDGALIPVEQILSGGPRKDGIPAIDNPSFVKAGKAAFLKGDAFVLGIHYHGIAKAYPVNILNWHEVVNDHFDDVPVVITFCPLCGSGMAFFTDIDEQPLTFGVSGLLYNSDVLLYDRQTLSLWSQLMRQGISGALKGKRLISLPVRYTTWRDWQSRYPGTLVLSADTGYERNYNNSPYGEYLRTPRLMFPVNAVSHLYHPKEEVFGLDIDGSFKVYPFIELEKSPASFSDTINGRLISIHYDHDNRSAAAFDQQGKQLPGIRTLWFAWYAFHPHTAVYQADRH